MWFLARSSRGTGPKMRVPIGSFLLSTSTAAFLSKRITLPSGAADVLGGAHHHRLHHVALLDAAARDRLLDRHDDDVADRSIFPLRAAQHLDAHDTTRAGIVRDVEVCLHLNHDWPPSSSWEGPRPRPAFRISFLRLLLGDDDPALVLGDRLRFLDEHHVADLEGVVLVMGLVLLGRRTVFFITGCVKRRSTLTTTVFSFLSLTTVPCRMRFGMVLSLSLLGGGFLRPQLS